MLGYDGSDSARRALACAADAAGSGGRVVVVTAVERAVDDAPRHGTASATDTPAFLADHAAELLSGRSLDVSVRIEEAEPAEALVATAREVGAGMIVVGARGDDYLARALRGSVGERLVARAPCDLLVVR